MGRAIKKEKGYATTTAVGTAIAMPRFTISDKIQTKAKNRAETNAVAKGIVDAFRLAVSSFIPLGISRMHANVRRRRQAAFLYAAQEAGANSSADAL